MELQRYEPRKKSKEEFLEEYEKTYTVEGFNTSLVPMTLEGCVVRVSDIISYIGRDVEDAIRIGVIDEDSVPVKIRSILGTKNSEIIDTIVDNLISNSIGKNYLCMSDEIFEGIKELKKFNYENIYNKACDEETFKYYELVFRTVFETMKKDIENNNYDSDIYTVFLNGQCDKYLEETSNSRKVIDYIAGMTDDYILREYRKITEKTN